MPEFNLVDDIKHFIAVEILDGEDMGELNESTPLLELGILNSMELTSLISHLEQTFAIKVPSDGIVPDNFETIGHIAKYVEQLQQGDKRAA